MVCIQQHGRVPWRGLATSENSGLTVLRFIGLLFADDSHLVKNVQGPQPIGDIVCACVDVLCVETIPRDARDSNQFLQSVQCVRNHRGNAVTQGRSRTEVVGHNGNLINTDLKETPT